MKIDTPADVIDAGMATEWKRTAMHEAGHAVAKAALGLPLYEVWVRLEEVPKVFGSTWRVLGRTEVASGGGTVSLDDADTDKWTLAVMAGLEAEVRWRMSNEGVWFACSARGMTTGSPYVKGDLKEIRTLLDSKHSTLTRDDAEAQTRQLVGNRWMAITRVGRALATTGHLSGSAVRSFL